MNLQVRNKIKFNNFDKIQQKIMSYYDPLYPAYEATRYQIQKTIFGLQQKLRKRKQLDLLLQRDIIQKQAVQRQRNLIEQPYIHRQIRPQQSLRQNLRNLRMFDPLRPVLPSYQQRLIIQKQALQFDYQQRLNRLRRQRQLLENQRSLQSYALQRSPIKYKDLLDSDDLLVKKYQDGSKISQYNEQLQRSNSKKMPQQQMLSSMKKHNQFLSHRQNVNRQNQNKFETPFDKLKFNQTQSKPFSNINDREPEYSNSKKRLYQESTANKGPYLKPKQQAGEATQATQQLINVNNKNQTRSPSKSPHKTSRRAISRSKSRNKLNKSLIKSTANLDRSRALTLQQSALKKIQNRLMVSSVIYEDSQYRNNKHQINHLYSTYENEIKVRKDVKDKINAHPMILRKHAMVVQN